MSCFKPVVNPIQVKIKWLKNRFAGSDLHQNLDLNALRSSENKDMIIYMLLLWKASSSFIGHYAFTLGDYQCQKKNDHFFDQKMTENEKMNEKYSKQAEDYRFKMEEELNSLKECEKKYKISINESNTHYINYQKQSVILEERNNEVARLQEVKSDLESQLSDLADENKKLSIELNR